MEKVSDSQLNKISSVLYRFLKDNNMKDLGEGRYDLDDNIYVNVESYNTFNFEERKYESHKKYVDVQYIIGGVENIIVGPIENLTISDEYDESRDIVFYDNTIRGMDNILVAGEMLLLEPHDGHMPCIKVDESVHVKKAVFKIPVDKVGK